MYKYSELIKIALKYILCITKKSKNLICGIISKFYKKYKKFIYFYRIVYMKGVIFMSSKPSSPKQPIRTLDQRGEQIKKPIYMAPPNPLEKNPNNK